MNPMIEIIKMMAEAHKASKVIKMVEVSPDYFESEKESRKKA
jgi:hypothetical protein